MNKVDKVPVFIESHQKTDNKQASKPIMYEHMINWVEIIKQGKVDREQYYEGKPDGCCKDQTRRP